MARKKKVVDSSVEVVGVIIPKGEKEVSPKVLSDGTSLAPEPDVIATLKGVYFFETAQGSIAWGHIFDDKSSHGNHPFEDGSFIRTSPVVKEEVINNKKFLFTKNSIYLISDDKFDGKTFSPNISGKVVSLGSHTPPKNDRDSFSYATKVSEQDVGSGLILTSTT